MTALGATLLLFVAAYSLFDNLNIIFMAMLQGAGDTLWTMVASVGAHLAYAAVLVFLAWWGVGLMVYWAWSTLFVVLVAGVWLLRYRGGKWRGMRVIENAIPPISGAASISNRFRLP